MEAQISEDFELEKEQKDIIEGIVDDTAENFSPLLEIADVNRIDIGGPTEYQEDNNRPMTGPGSSPPLWRHNLFEEGELQIYVQNPLHVPHEMAHQIENIYNQIEAVAAEETTKIDTDSAVDKAFSESFAYLNQLKYFPKMPEAIDVEFEDLEKLETEETSWQKYEDNPRDNPDLYHAAGYQAALAMHNHDVEPREMLEEPETYGQVVEDAVAAAWIAGRNHGELDREDYNEVVAKSVENRLEET